MRSTKEFAIGIIPSFIYLSIITFIVRNFYVDDAYIGFRYLDNFLSGNGFVFNPAEKIEGITNIGWVIFLIPFSYIFGIPVSSKFIGFCLVTYTFTMSYFIAQRLNQEKNNIHYIAVPFLIAIQFDYVYFSLAGMETALLSSTLVTALYLIIINRHNYLVAFLCAFSFLVHPESVLVFPLFLCLIFLTKTDGFYKYLKPSIIFFSAVAIFTLIRYLYFNDILPNTFYAKQSTIKNILKSILMATKGWSTNFPPPYNSVFIFLFVLFGVFSLYRKSKAGVLFMVAVVISGTLFSIYALQDWSYLGRYFAPYLPFVIIFFWRGFIEANEILLNVFTRGRILNFIISSYLAIFFCLGISDAFMHLRASYTESYPGYVLTTKNLVEPSIWIRDNIEEDALLATRRIGAVGFFSKRRIFDWKFGLVDRRISELRRVYKEEFRYPTNPALKEIWKQVAPDYLLEDSQVIQTIIKEAEASEEGFEVHSIPYRVKKKFRIGQGVDWVLCEKIKE